MNTPSRGRGTDPVDVEVGLNVRRLRKLRGMSQTALGEALGITFQQIQKYERGTNRISASMMVKAARCLGVQPADLMPTTDAVPLAPSASLLTLRGADELLQNYATLKPRHRRALLSLARSMSAHLDEAEETRVGA